MPRSERVIPAPRILSFSGLLLLISMLSGCVGAGTYPPAQSVAPSPAPVVGGHLQPMAAGYMIVETAPRGGVVVVDGRPVGPAPQAVTVAVNRHGFLHRPLSVKVRFVAGRHSRESATTEVRLTPLDRLPTRLVVTPAGSQRQISGG